MSCPYCTLNGLEQTMKHLADAVFGYGLIGGLCVVVATIPMGILAHIFELNGIAWTVGIVICGGAVFLIGYALKDSHSSDMGCDGCSCMIIIVLFLLFGWGLSSVNDLGPFFYQVTGWRWIISPVDDPVLAGIVSVTVGVTIGASLGVIEYLKPGSDCPLCKGKKTSIIIQEGRTVWTSSLMEEKHVTAPTFYCRKCHQTWGGGSWYER
jgi:hypothetical protein